MHVSGMSYFWAIVWAEGSYSDQGCIQKFRQGGGANLRYGQKGGGGGRRVEAHVRCYTLGGGENDTSCRPPLKYGPGDHNLWQSQVENEHYSTVSGLIRLVIIIFRMLY